VVVLCCARLYLNGDVPGEGTTAKGGQVFNIENRLAIISIHLVCFRYYEINNKIIQNSNYKNK